jgi:tetratricopeptide (TPR) repeat protein
MGGIAWNFLWPVMSKPPDSHTREAIQRADEWMTKAIATDPNVYQFHGLKAWVLIMQMRPEEAIIAAERSLALNPSYVNVYSPLAAAHAVSGHPERAVELADKAIRLSPRDPELLSLYFQKTYSYFMMQQDAQVIEWARRTLAAQKREWPIPRLYLAAALALNGSETEAREIIKHYLSLPGVEIRSIRDWTAWLYLWSDTPFYSAFVKRLYEGLRRAGMPEQ